MEKQIRIGVVGLGMGRDHIRHFEPLKNAKVQAVCDTDAARLGSIALEFAVPQTFSDYGEFLEKAEIDAVVIAVPNYLHKPMVIAAIERGLHVLCEKPMAMNTAEALEIREKARAGRGKFMMHFNRRFGPEPLYFKSLIESGKLGPIYYGTAGWRRMRGMPGFGGWFGQKSLSGGGPLIDLGVHMLDLARWLMGSPAAVTVSASTFSHIGRKLAHAEQKEFDVEDLAAALIRFDNDSTLMLEVSWALNFEEREKIFLELSGTKGGLSNVIYDWHDLETAIFHDENGALVKTVPEVFPESCQVTAQQHFIECILHDREPDAGADDGVEIMRMLDAIYESARLGREVEVGGKIKS
jgi:predicted dehydrogenase